MNNGDGTSDILWQNQSNGGVIAWFIKNGAYNSWAYLNTAPLSDWKAIGSGDYNGDRTSDVLWQNQSNGGVIAWFVKNGAKPSPPTLIER